MSGVPSRSFTARYNQLKPSLGQEIMVKGNASAFVPYCVSNYDYGGYHRKLLF
jgi:hypothetical protein